MEALKIQTQIRHNSEEISSYFSDLVKWEKEIKKKDQRIQEKKSISLPVRGAGTIRINSTPNSTSLSPSPSSSSSSTTLQSHRHENISKISSAAQHTYDIGYKKWERFEEEEEEDEGKRKEQQRSERRDRNERQENEIIDPTALTPATLVKISNELPKVC
jgi:hypothetical protein